MDPTKATRQALGVIFRFRVEENHQLLWIFFLPFLLACCGGFFNSPWESKVFFFENPTPNIARSTSLGSRGAGSLNNFHLWKQHDLINLRPLEAETVEKKPRL